MSLLTIVTLETTHTRTHTHAHTPMSLWTIYRDTRRHSNVRNLQSLFHIAHVAHWRWGTLNMCDVGMMGNFESLIIKITHLCLYCVTLCLYCLTLCLYYLPWHTTTLEDIYVSIVSLLNTCMSLLSNYRDTPRHLGNLQGLIKVAHVSLTPFHMFI